MAQNRVYFARMPSNAGTMPFLDIIVQGPVGSPTAPVGLGPGTTPAPSGWGTGGQFTADSDGVYCELRSRIFRVPTLFGQPNFVPRLRLGWKIDIYPVQLGDGCSGDPMVILSESLVGQFPLPFSDVSEADPSYGNTQSPVIRLRNTPDVQSGKFVIGFTAYEAKDEDRSPTGV